MADTESDGNTKGSPLVLIMLIVNLIGLGGVGFLQFKAHKREADRPNVEDVVRAQMKDMAPDMMAAGAAGKEGGGSEAGLGGKEALSKDDVEKLFPLTGGFTANLAQADGPKRYIKLDIVLKFSKESKKEEYEAKVPQMRDTIIGLLNTKKADDLLKIEGKEFLKEEIKSAINAYFVEGKIEDIYYVDFQVN